ncbi:MAG: hypothetical protein ACREXR_16870, partial [Gammaproteobacteria bacterium]
MNVLAKRITRKQSGAALIAFLLVFITAASFKLLKNLNVLATKRYSDAQTAQALTEAKAALIGYAASDSNRPGELPCPDFNNDGWSRPVPEYAGPDCKRLLGWLPWKTLRLPETADGAAERLWYAVSDDYHANGAAKLNSDVQGQLPVDGVNDVVAVILAPFEPVGGQSGRPGTDAEVDVGKYLEDINSDGDLTNYTASGAGVINDRLITITRRDLMIPTERRVAGELRNVLKSYFATSNYYPYAAEFDASTYTCTPNVRHGRLPLVFGPDCSTLTDWGGTAVLPLWFEPNDWHTVTYYAVAPSCTKTTPGCDDELLTVNNVSPAVDKKQAVVVMT